MATLSSSFVMMRWELLSAMMMFFASTLNVVCRNNNRYALSFIFSAVGISMACWFVTSLLGIRLSFEIASREFWANSKQLIIYLLSHTPPDWQIS
ncbi:YjcB family protein [Acerihabitans sp. TG2]|uniref:YjcB family protein n=1 Tax=Acerihabitans sp. TG2 TaxID=3096008 RepID=UPI002B232849|nr:YjcB family protein [Acerihabitans sp. TG2]MEA9390563.1 YjcB family protein [Acerihabitans sp. TG2]